jgi:hypothetical protein
MALYRHIDQDKRTAYITYKGEQITPEFRIDDAKEVLDVLTNALERAYQKIRDAGVA